MVGKQCRDRDDPSLRRPYPETPSFAIETACNEVGNMGKVAVANLKIASAALVDADDNFCEQVFENEETIDRMEKMLTGISLKDQQPLLE